MYAIQTIIIKKNMPLEDALKKAKDITKRPPSKKMLVRELKDTWHFRNIPKTKFVKKSFRSKIINPDITLVFAELKPENSHLSDRVSGDGIFSDILNYGIRKIVPKAVQRVSQAFTKVNEFNNVSSKTLEEFGNNKILSLQIYRTPISNILNTAMNFISLGKWDQLRKKYGYDKLFHTALVADVGGKNIIIEKNEVVNISTSYKTNSNTQTYPVNLENKEFTLIEMVNKCRERMGDKSFFDYDAFSNNCQVFIKNMLEGMGIYNTQIEKFLFQDLSEIYKQLPSYTSKIAKLITRAGAFVSRLRGDGNDGEDENNGGEGNEGEDNKDNALVYRGKCTKNTPFATCFQKGYRVGYYLANNPLIRKNKQQLIDLCRKYNCVGVNKETTNRELINQLRLLGANIDLKDLNIEEEEKQLKIDIERDKVRRKEIEELDEIDDEDYYRKKERFNQPLYTLSRREMINACKKIGCKDYKNRLLPVPVLEQLRNEELQQYLKKSGYKDKRV